MTSVTASRITVTRQQLYDQVWATPMRKLATTYGLSDVGLAKVCRRHEIPRPPVGYWAKKEFGKPVRQAPLRNVSDPELETIVFYPDEVRETKHQETERELPSFEDLADLVKQELGRQGTIAVPATLSSPHPVVVSTRDALHESSRERLKDQYGMIHPSYRMTNRCFSVSIGKDSIPRAMRLLQALIRVLESRGFELKLSRDENKRPHFVGCKTSLVVSISEKSTRSEHELTPDEKERLKKYPSSSWRPRWDYTPSGLLTLTVKDNAEFGEDASWKETKRKPLEEQLNDIVLGIPYIIERSRKRKIEHDEWTRRYREEQQRRFEEEETKRKEAKRIQELFEEVDAWTRAGSLRDYADNVRSELIDRCGQLDPSSDIAHWLDWVNGIADRMDPLRKRCANTKDRKTSNEAKSGQSAVENSGIPQSG